MISLLVEIGALLVIAYGLLTGGMWYRHLWYPAAYALILLFYLWFLEYRHRRPDLSFRTGLEMPIALFFGWALITSAFSICLSDSIYELFRLGLLLGFFFMVASHFQSEKREKMLIFILFLMIVFIAGYGLISYFGREPVRYWFIIQPESSAGAVSATYNNHNHFAGLMELGIFLGLGLVMSFRVMGGTSRSEWIARMVIAGLPVLGMLIALLFSMSRGGWIAFGLALLVWLLIFNQSWVRQYWWSVGIGLILLFLLVIYPQIKTGDSERKETNTELAQRIENLTSRMETVTELSAPSSGISFGGRVSIWDSTLRIMLAHPLAGTGLGTLQSAYPRYRRPDMLLGVNFAHQDYLQAGAELGIPGLTLVLAMLAIGLLRGWQNIWTEQDNSRQCIMAGLWCGILAISIHGLVDFNFHVPVNIMVTSVFMALLTRQVDEEDFDVIIGDEE